MRGLALKDPAKAPYVYDVDLQSRREADLSKKKRRRNASEAPAFIRFSGPKLTIQAREDG